MKQCDDPFGNPLPPRNVRSGGVSVLQPAAARDAGAGDRFAHALLHQDPPGVRASAASTGSTCGRRMLLPLWPRGCRGSPRREFPFKPARVIMQDFTGVPAIVDLAAMRDAMAGPGRGPAQDQSGHPRGPRDRPFGPGGPLRLARALVGKHRARVRAKPASATSSFAGAQKAFADFRVVPPATGIVHQVNLEFLAASCSPQVRGRGRRSPTRLSAPIPTPP